MDTHIFDDLDEGVVALYYPCGYGDGWVKCVIEEKYDDIVILKRKDGKERVSLEKDGYSTKNIKLLTRDGKPVRAKKFFGIYIY